MTDLTETTGTLVDETEYEETRDERDALRAKLARYEAVVEAVKPYLEWHGGCDHHPDDCPGSDELCRIVRAVNAALHALDSETKHAAQDAREASCEHRPLPAADFADTLCANCGVKLGFKCDLCGCAFYGEVPIEECPECAQPVP